MRDDLVAAAEAYAPGFKNDDLTAAFIAGARWAIEEAARIAEDDYVSAGPNGNPFDAYHNLVSAGIAIKIRARAAEGASK